MTKVAFHKDENGTGGWLFDSEFGGQYMALRNIAGFAGRDWELYVEQRTEVVGSSDIASWKLVEDQLSSRGECVEVANEHSEREYRQSVTFNENGALVL